MSPTPSKLEVLKQRLADRRSREVLFVSHCLLNQNVRYLGGAAYPGAVAEVLDEARESGVGLCQMPCPEQVAWGGVLKPALAPAFGAVATPAWPLRGVLLRLFRAYTRGRYRLLARRVGGQVASYRRSGFTVKGIVGVAGSPSCGVRTAMDPAAWLEAVGRCDPATIDIARVNAIVRDCATPGEGWFMESLRENMEKRAMKIQFTEHDLGPALGQSSRPGWRQTTAPVGSRISKSTSDRGA